jgi:intein/homing endonuclease
MIQDSGMTEADYERSVAMGSKSAFARTSVTKSAELRRILALPRRVWEEKAQELVPALSEYLRAPGGTQTLRPVQAISLVEMHDFGGLLGIIRVGGGKCSEFDTEVFDASTGCRRMVGEIGAFAVPALQSEGLGAGRLEVAQAVAFASGRKECFELVLANGMSLRASFDHPVLTSNGWVWMRDLKEGDLVAVARTIPEPTKLTAATDEEVLFAAYLLADGGVSTDHTVFCDDNQKVTAEVRNLSAALASGTGYERARGGATEEFNIRGAAAFRQKWNIHGLSKHKRVPASFWGLPRRQIALFLNRFWACDGYHNKGKGFETTLASEKLIDDLQFMLLRLGIKGRKRFKVAKIKGKQFDAWRLSVTGEDAIRFYETVGPIFGVERRSTALYEELKSLKRNTNIDVVPVGPQSMDTIGAEMGWPGRGHPDTRDGGGRRTEFREFTSMTSGQLISRERFAAACEHFGYEGSLKWLATSDLAWERVRSLTPRGERDVFDVSVPGYGNFVANGIVIHNTLLSALGAIVLEAKKPLLIVPAKLVEKTRLDMNRLRKHWLVPHIPVVSYEILGREQASSYLQAMAPDLIIADECHKLRNTQAAVTRRVKRWMEEHPETKFVGLSGTIMKRSLHDYYHLAAWSLKRTNPTPTDFNDRMAWAAVLDEKKNKNTEQLEAKIAPGALIEFCNNDERELYKTDPIKAVRSGYRRRLVETPGVIATQEGALGMSLIINSQVIKIPGITEAVRSLKKEWKRPDGEPVMDAIEIWRHLREIACGFYYRWNPMPPREWLDSRKAWARAVREILRNNRIGLDSEGQIRRFVLKERADLEAGLLAPSKVRYEQEYEVLKAWRETEPTFTPNQEAVWLSHDSLDHAARWMDEEKGICWVEHVEYGRELAARTGIAYYQRAGLNEKKQLIDDHPKGTPLIASIASNAEGRNLQAWSTNLVTSPPTSGALWEQLLGRCHRDGQEADEVTYTLLISLAEQAAAFDRARADARTISDTIGQEQKLCYADVSVVPPNEAPTGLE